MTTTVQFNPEWDVWRNGQVLARVMQYERKAQFLRGFFLDYGGGEVKSHRNFSPTFVTDCGFLMGAARDERRDVKVFRNMNGQIGASLS